MWHSRLALFLYLFFVCVQAKVWKTGSSGNSNLKAIQVNEALEPQNISPTLKPESSKTFFKKDYPYDKRPPVGRLHFSYPYPAVQDSGDYDKDYIKDENSDNGELHAQTEYDRLRHKLTEEQKDAKKALAEKEKEEQRLKELLDQYNRALAKAKSAEARKHAAEEDVKSKRKAEEETGEAAEEAGGWDWWKWCWWPWNWGKSECGEKPPEEPKPSDGVEEATADTQKKMSELEECEKELAETRERLKKLMDDLDKAKAAEGDTENALAEARRRETEAERQHRLAEEALAKEKAEHGTAEAAYLKQKAIVDQMEKELQVKADKVRKHRREEDADGGVYPTKPTKSAGMPVACASASMLIVALGLQTL